jgi:hypothetical protein
LKYLKDISEQSSYTVGGLVKVTNYLLKMDCICKARSEEKIWLYYLDRENCTLWSKVEDRFAKHEREREDAENDLKLSDILLKTESLEEWDSIMDSIDDAAKNRLRLNATVKKQHKMHLFTLTTKPEHNLGDLCYPSFLNDTGLTSFEFKPNI